MGIFDLFQKKTTNSNTLNATAEGTFVPMENIPDDVFATGILGICCGIDPTEGKVYAPADGTVTQLAESLHAVGISTPSGVEILIHVGIDTVEMKGEGFTPFVKENDRVEKGQLILTMDLAKIKAAGYSPIVITAITNSDDFAQVTAAASGTVTPETVLFQIKK